MLYLMFIYSTVEPAGWLAMGVPGELHGMWTAYQQFGGAIPWHQLVQPTVDLLAEGETS